MKPAVLATILGFGAIIAVLVGLVIGWKWIAPATEKPEEAKITESVIVEKGLISTIESIPGMERWELGYDDSWHEGKPYDLMIDIGEETVYFHDRKSLSDFFDDIDKLEVFQNE
jgi:hypothetical protein